MKARSKTKSDPMVEIGELRGRLEIMKKSSQGIKEEERNQAKDPVPFMSRFPEENPNPVMRISAKGELLYANRAATKMLEAMGWQESTPLPEELSRSIRGALEKKTAKSFELLCTRKRVFSFVLSSRGREGDINLYALDITPRKRAEETLRKAYEELEVRVQERTQDLKKANVRLRESEKRLKHLSAQLLKAQEEERRKIAVDVHDNLGTSLATIKFKLERVASQFGKDEPRISMLKETIASVQRCAEQCRRIQVDLRPFILDDLGILPTLRWVCREYEKTYPIHIEQEVAIQEDEIQIPLKIVIYRIIQEALHNIAKHSNADLLRISLQKTESAIQLTVQDNGRGFDTKKLDSNATPDRGLGLSSMRERAELFGGSLGIETAIGKGTTIKVAWPLP